MKKTIISVICAIGFLPLFSQQLLTLEQCKELAIQNSHQVQNAALSVSIAQEQKKEAFTKYFPNVSATGLGFTANKSMISSEIDLSSMTAALAPMIGWLMQQGAPIDPSALQGISEPQKIEALSNGVLLGVMATQPIFAGGQIINGNKLAKTGVEVKQLQKQMTEDEVLLETERYFWMLVSLKEKKKTIENSEAMLSSIISDVKVAVEAGLTTRNDLLRVELEQNKLASGRLKVENGIMMIKISLGQKIGITSDKFDVEQPQLGEIELPLFNNDNNIVTRRPEYRLLEKSIDVARMQRDMELGKRLPTVAIGAGYNYLDFDMNKTNPMKTDFGLLFATVSVPITDWWGGSHAIKRKKMEIRLAENTKEENTELLLQQMQNVRNGLHESYSQVMIAKKSISSAEENLRMSKDNYNAGISTLSDLLEAQNLYQQSRDQYTEAATEYMVKLADYRKISK